MPRECKTDESAASKGQAKKRERLTPTRIATWKPEGEAWLRDTKSHLAVRARPARGGISKTFVFDSTLAYQRVRIAIGDVDTWNLSDALELAQEWQKLIDEGRDPREVIREREAAAQAAKAAAAAAEEVKRAAAEAAKAEADRQARYTLRALCDAYLSALERAGKAKSAAGARSLFKCHIDQDTANKPARAVTAHEVAALVRRVREAGKERAAGVLRSYLSAAFNAAKRAPFDSALPADLIPFGIEHNPVDATPAIAVQRGDRTLSAAEVCAGIGGEPFNVRDIRRTVETMLAALGISKDTRAQLLSHGISGVQAAHYDRHAYTDEKRAALVDWEVRLEAIRQAERTPSNVVRLGQRAVA